MPLSATTPADCDGGDHGHRSPRDIHYISKDGERSMRAKVAKWGNSLAVRLPKPLAEDLGLAAGREVELRRHGDRLTMEMAPQRKIPRYRLGYLLAQIKPGQKPPPLQDWSAVEPPWPDDDWSDIAPSDEEWIAMKRRAGAKGGKRKRRA